MSKFKIELTDNGVSILTKKTQVLYDEAGNPVEIPQGNHRQAIGVGDYGTVEEFQQAIRDLTGTVIGTDFATGIADIKTAVDKTAEKDKEVKDKEAELSEKDKTIQALAQELETANAELSIKDTTIADLQQQVADLEAQIFQEPVQG